MNNIELLNQLKLECQGLMPLVELLKNKSAPNTLSGLERDQKLAIMGYSLDEIEEMTGFKQGDYPLLSNQQSTEESRLRFYGREILDKMEALKARTDKEWRAEHDRMLEHGISLGWIEGEMNCGANI